MPLRDPDPSPLDLSIVVPIYDEEENLPILHGEVVAALEPTGLSWELVLVDDASGDRSLPIMRELWREDPHVRVVQLRGRSGQTAAMAAGFDEARGRVVVTMDGDLQNDPADVPRLVERLEQGDADIVAGWRKRRHDGFLLRRLPSLAANRLIAWVTGVSIHDTGCTLKAFRRALVRNLPIYAEQHRFLPAMSAGSGARVVELVVNHRARRFGRSKYGLGRATRVALDLMTIKLVTHFSQAPLQYFATIALLFLSLTTLLVAAGVRELSRGGGERILDTMLVVGFLLTFLAAAYFLMLGFLAELVVKASDFHGEERGRRLSTARLGGEGGSGG